MSYVELLIHISLTVTNARCTCAVNSHTSRRVTKSVKKKRLKTRHLEALESSLLTFPERAASEGKSAEGKKGGKIHDMRVLRIIAGDKGRFS